MSYIDEPVTVIAGFDNMAMMRQSIKQCYHHLFITKDIRPFNEAEIGGDNDADTLIQLAEKMEQQGTTCLLCIGETLFFWDI